MALGVAKPPPEATGRPDRRRFWWAAAGVLAAGLLVRAGLLAAQAFPFNADEAVVGLMARHILGGNWPTFFYGQAYMGSLDAALVASTFALLGESVLAIRLVQTALFLATIMTAMLLARGMGFSVAVCSLVGLALALPSVNVTLYTTISLGGYGEALLIGNLVLITTLALLRREARTWVYVLWGGLVGFGLWVFGLTLVYSIPAALLLFIATFRRQPPGKASLRLAAAVGGLLIGAVPMVMWGAQHGPEVLARELLGSAIAGASPAALPSAIASHLVNFVLFAPTVILGIRPPWSVTPLGLPLAPIVALLWLAAMGVGLRRASWPERGLAGRSLLLGVALTLLVGFLLTPFGADPSGRYFLPLAVPLSIFAAAGVQAARVITGHRWPYGIAVSLLLFNLWSVSQSASREPRLTSQFDAATVLDHSFDAKLADFLLKHNETAGYTTYWVAYPLAFLSQERLVYLPYLPYHSDFRYTTRDDRYEPYRAVVAAEPRPAYITARQPWLDAYLRQALHDRKVGFEETAIGDYNVFHSLTQEVRPEDLGLGPEAAQ